MNLSRYPVEKKRSAQNKGCETLALGTHRDEKTFLNKRANGKCSDSVGLLPVADQWEAVTNPKQKTRSNVELRSTDNLGISSFSPRASDTGNLHFRLV